VPSQAKPKSTIGVFPFSQIYAADEPLWVSLKPEGPMPCISALHRRKCSIAIVRIGSVRRIGPGNDIREIANDLPMWKQELRLLGVCKHQWTQKETRSLKLRYHFLKIITQIPEPIISAQITQLSRWRNHALTLMEGV